MISPILTGILSAFIVFFSQYLHHFLLFQSRWSFSVFIVGAGILLCILRRVAIQHPTAYRSYDGLTDFFLYIHPSSHLGSKESSLRWVLRGCGSFLLTLCTGMVGVEGAAIEWSHALHLKVGLRVSRWFEQRRRTEVASVLAASLSAAFQSPFAGMLIALELGIGGRSLSAATSAFVAFLISHFLLNPFSFQIEAVRALVHSVSWLDGYLWLSVGVIGVFSGLIAAGMSYFIYYTREGFQILFADRMDLKILGATVLLFFLMLMQNPHYLLPSQLFEHLLTFRINMDQALFTFFLEWIALAIILSGFGTAGLLWPLFVLGGLVGFYTNTLMIPDAAHLNAIIILIGGASLLGAVLGIPWTASVMVFEMTHSPQLFVFCLASVWLAQLCCRLFRVRPLITQQLIDRGLNLVEGRSSEILEAISVRDAMMTDMECVNEKQTLTELKVSVMRSKYSFLPVINGWGKFLGLLTIDQIQEAVAHPTTNTIIEAKDLLYKSSFKTPLVRGSDSLKAVVGLFDEVPCIPVLSAEDQVMGLLFIYSVRQAYEKEATKQTVFFVRDDSVAIG